MCYIIICCILCIGGLSEFNVLHPSLCEVGLPVVRQTLTPSALKATTPGTIIGWEGQREACRYNTNSIILLNRSLFLLLLLVLYYHSSVYSFLIFSSHCFNQQHLRSVCRTLVTHGTGFIRVVYFTDS